MQAPWGSCVEAVMGMDEEGGAVMAVENGGKPVAMGG